MTSWRQNHESGDWLTWVDLIDPRTNEPREVTVTIESVKAGVVTGEGGIKSRKNTFRYKGWPKPHAVGATICKVLERQTGTDQIERWVGQRVTLYVDTTRAKAGGQVNCIRVKPMAARAGTPDAAPSREPPPSAAVEQKVREVEAMNKPREPGED